jgi:ribosomal protein S18 acetylase RimI-like enzyme
VIIREIKNEARKASITNEVLRSLPEWFGIESAIVEYVEAVREKYFLTAEQGSDIAGFIAIGETSEFAGEIFLIGVKKEYQGTGTGTLLVQSAEHYLKKEGKPFLSVKTLGPSHDDLNYAKTRRFYRHAGFYPLEEIKEIWGEKNPCLIMIKHLG